MNEKILQRILSELTELRAQVAQLGPVRRTPTFEAELDQIATSGGDIIQYLRDKRKRERKK